VREGWKKCRKKRPELQRFLPAVFAVVFSCLKKNKKRKESKVKKRN
jgi:hypothetical protein